MLAARQPNAAQAAFKRALALHPDDAAMVVNLAMLRPTPREVSEPKPMPPPSRPQGPTIRQLIPAGRTDTAFFNNDEDFQCRVVCYALVEQPTGATQVDAVIARGPEDDLDDGQQLQLASVYRREQQLATWAMRPVGEVTYTLERVPPPVHGVHPASDGERRLLGVNEQAESGFVVRHVIPSPHETGACDVLMERTAPR